MTLPHLGSLLLSLALVAPRLLGEEGESLESAPAPSEQTPATPTAAGPSTKTKNPPPFLVPNPPSPGAAKTQEKPGGSQTRPSPADSLQPSRLRVNASVSVVSGALRESFRYDPTLHTQGPTSESSDSDTAMGDSADSAVVTLPKITVNERPLPRDLGADIARWRSQAPQNHSRFGTGVHEKDFGKVRVSVMTLFYIPIGAGVRW
jgi:hypothetical protein